MKVNVEKPQKFELRFKKTKQKKTRKFEINSGYIEFRDKDLLILSIIAYVWVRKRNVSKRHFFYAPKTYI